MVNRWGVDLYRLVLARYGGMYKVGWWLAIYIMCSWGWDIYSGYRALLVLYSMNRSSLAIYRVGGVGDMRHLK